MRLRKSLVLTLLGCIASNALQPVVAGTFTISPLRVDFGGSKTTAVLTVRNEDAAAVVVQTQGLAWSQEGVQDALNPSRDLLISPAVFTLPPGGSQVVRVALRRPPDAARELSYRVTLQEVPQTAQPGFTGLQVALRLSLPVFVAPLGAAEPRLEWHARRDADGALEVAAQNTGSAHARVHGFSVSAVDGDGPVLDQASFTYVLPGATRRWTFDDNNKIRSNAVTTAVAGASGPYRLQGKTDRGEFATELTLAAD